MQQLLNELLADVQTLLNQGVVYFQNLSLANQFFLIIACLLPYVNPIKVLGKAGFGIKIVQAALSLIIVAVLIRTPMTGWLGLVTPIQLAILSAILTVNNRMDALLKREFEHFKKMRKPSFPRIVLPTADSQSVAQ